jgi:hypothetical protein
LFRFFDLAAGKLQGNFLFAELHHRSQQPSKPLQARVSFLIIFAQVKCQFFIGFVELFASCLKILPFT